MKDSEEINIAENISKELEALEKIDHTICLNINEMTLKFGLDDLDHVDCKDANELFDCYDIIKSALDRKEKLEKAIELAKQIGWKTVDYVLQFKTYKEFMSCSNSNRVYDIVKRAEFKLLKEVLG